MSKSHLFMYKLFIFKLHNFEEFKFIYIYIHMYIYIYIYIYILSVILQNQSLTLTRTDKYCIAEPSKED